MIVVHTWLETKPSKFQLFILYYIEHFQPMVIKSVQVCFRLRYILIDPKLARCTTTSAFIHSLMNVILSVTHRYFM